MMFHRQLKTASAQVTVDAYTDVNLYDVGQGDPPTTLTPILSLGNGGPLSFHVWNTGANNIDFKVLASNDRTLVDALWVDLALTLTAVAASTGKTASIASPAHAYYKAQTKASVAAAQGAANVAVNQNGMR